MASYGSEVRDSISNRMEWAERGRGRRKPVAVQDHVIYKRNDHGVQGSSG